MAREKGERNNPTTIADDWVNREKMKILILANADMGLYKFRKELIEELVKDHKVFFCTPEGEYVSLLQSIGCEFISCDTLKRRGTNPFSDFKLLVFYKRAIKELRPDVILTYTIKPNVYGGIASGRNKVPYIANVTGLGTSIENGGLLSKIATTLYKIGLRKAKCVFFQNGDNQKTFLEKRIVTCKTRVIPGSGVNLLSNCVEAYPSDKDGIRFLFVGRIMKDKGIEELLQSIRRIHRERSNVVLSIVGFCDEDYSKSLEDAEKEGAIIYHGVQNDMHSFYKNCHCTVLPSYHEGMANVLLESSSTGRPVIATNVPGCQETFEEGITGFGCDARSVESLYKAMNRFINLPYSQKEEMGKNARKKMEAEYDRRIVVKAYLNEIELLTKD